MPIDPTRPPARFPFAPDLLAGQTALVTGGGTGLGRAIAEGLARAGADVLIAARRAEVLEVAAKEIRESSGRRVEIATVNIRDRESVEALAAHADARMGGIDVLVNNAGGQFPQRARDIRPKGWHAVIETNLYGTWNMTQVFGNRMIERGGGVVTQVIALIGMGFPGLAHTAAARAGVAELTRTLAFEWGPKVRLNCVAPGAVDTQGFGKTYDMSVIPGMRKLPIPRFGLPEEVAHAAVFLSSPAASWITGEVLFVAGGQQVSGPGRAIGADQFEGTKE